MITRIIEIDGDDYVVLPGGDVRRHGVFYGLYTDVKPTDANNADIFYEMDTKKVFLFDAENKVWLEQ